MRNSLLIVTTMLVAGMLIVSCSGITPAPDTLPPPTTSEATPPENDEGTDTTEGGTAEAGDPGFGGHPIVPIVVPLPSNEGPVVRECGSTEKPTVRLASVSLEGEYLLIKVGISCQKDKVIDGGVIVKDPISNTISIISMQAFRFYPERGPKSWTKAATYSVLNPRGVTPPPSPSLPRVLELWVYSAYDTYESAGGTRRFTIMR